MSTIDATFHRGVDVDVVEGLEPGTRYEHQGISYSTLPLPGGRQRCRFATVNDVHFGETEAGRVGDSELGPILSAAPGQPAHPEVMNRAAIAELIAADKEDPFAAVMAKGDLTAEGADAEFAEFEACYRTPFGAASVRRAGQSRLYVRAGGVRGGSVDRARRRRRCAARLRRSGPRPWEPDGRATRVARCDGRSVDRSGGRHGPPSTTFERCRGRELHVDGGLRARPSTTSSPGAWRSSPIRQGTRIATGCRWQEAGCRASKWGA